MVHSLPNRSKLLVVSIDRHIFEDGSAVRLRMQRYAALVDSFDIIALNAPFAHSKSDLPIRISDNALIYPVGRTGKLMALIRAFRIASRIADRSTILSVQDPFELGIFGLLIKWRTKCALHVQVHIDFFSPYFAGESLRQRIQSVIAPHVLKRADGVRVVSAKIGRYLVSRIGIEKEKITTAPVYVNAETVRRRPATIDLHKIFPEFDWIVLVAARYVKQKNIPLAIKAFETFRRQAGKEAVNTGLVIAGSGPEEDHIRNIIADKDIGSHVKLGSWATEFSSCMKTCDVFLMSSDYEGWGMTVVEAASCGKPVIMTDVGCAGEFLNDRKNGLVVPVRDAKAMADAIAILYRDRGSASDLGRAAKESVAIYSAQAENDRLIRDSWKAAGDCVSIAE